MRQMLLAALVLAAAGAASAQIRASTTAPASLPTPRTPQFILLTHEGPVSQEPHDLMLNAIAGRSSNGCPVTATMFATVKDTQCGVLLDLYRRGFEIAAHTMNGTKLGALGMDQIRDEVVGTRVQLEGCGMEAGTIQGFRAPGLESKPEVRQVLQSNFFLYDSSLVEEGTGQSLSKGMGARVWPFDMEFGIPINCALYNATQQCELAEYYQGLWEVPVWSLTALGGPYTIDPASDGKQDVYDVLKANFDAAYNGNRAPLPVYITSTWLKDPTHKSGLDRFIGYASSRQDVYFITMRQLIAWMKSPISVEALSPAKLGCGNQGGAPATAGQLNGPPMPPPPFPPGAPAPALALPPLTLPGVNLTLPPGAPALPINLPPGAPALPINLPPGAPALPINLPPGAPAPAGLPINPVPGASPGLPIDPLGPMPGLPLGPAGSPGLPLAPLPSAPGLPLDPLLMPPAAAPAAAPTAAPPLTLLGPLPSLPDPIASDKPMPPTGIRIILTMGGTTQERFRAITEGQLLTVLRRQLGTQEVFLASLGPMPTVFGLSLEEASSLAAPMPGGTATPTATPRPTVPAAKVGAASLQTGGAAGAAPATAAKGPVPAPAKPAPSPAPAPATAKPAPSPAPSPASAPATAKPAANPAPSAGQDPAAVPAPTPASAPSAAQVAPTPAPAPSAAQAAPTPAPAPSAEQGTAAAGPTGADAPGPAPASSAGLSRRALREVDEADLLSAAVVAGGPDPLALKARAEKAIRDGTVATILALSGTYMARAPTVIPFENGEILLPPEPGTPSPAPPPPPTNDQLDSTDGDSGSSGGGPNVGAIVGGIIGTLVFIAAVAAAYWFGWRQRRRAAALPPPPPCGNVADASATVVVVRSGSGIPRTASGKVESRALESHAVDTPREAEERT